MGWRSLAALLLAALPVLAAAQALELGMRAQSVAADVWFVQGQAALGSAANRNFISSAGFVVTDAGVVVIDALGSPALAAAPIAELRRITSQPTAGSTPTTRR